MFPKVLSCAALIGVALTLASAIPSAAHAQSTNSSGRVLALREVTLQTGANAQEFERYVAAEYAPAVESAVPGLKAYLLKGDRGDRKNEYVLVWEFDSVNRRNEYFPTEGEGASERFQQLTENLAPDKLASYLKIAPDADQYTDYVVLR